MPTVVSNTAFVAPAFSATAKPCNFAGIGAHHVHAKHAVGIGIDHQFHQRAFAAAAAQGVLQRAETRSERYAPRRPLPALRSSVSPTVPMFGWVNTAVGMPS